MNFYYMFIIQGVTMEKDTIILNNRSNEIIEDENVVDKLFDIAKQNDLNIDVSVTPDSKKIRIEDDSKVVTKERTEFDGGFTETISSFDKSEVSTNDIKKLYDDKNYTQEKIEEITGISQTTISRRTNED